MAFGVRKFPASNDPRGCAFASAGFADGALPAHRYTLSTWGALSPFEKLNDGLTVWFDSHPPDQHIWTRTWPPGGGLNAVFIIEGYEVVQPTPHDWTIRWFVEFDYAGASHHIGGADALFPNAITGWPTINVSPVSGHPLLIPNPVTITPRIWNWPD